MVAIGQVLPALPLSSAEATAQIVRTLREWCHSAGNGGADAGAVPTGLPDLDAVLPRGGLDRGAIHEWIGVAQQEVPDGPHPSRRAGRGAVGMFPLGVLMWLAVRAAQSDPVGQGHLVWVGPAVWPYPPALVQAGLDGTPAMLDRSLFVRARGTADRLWATDLALRSRAAAVVIADGTGFDLASTRRLQLAAEAGGGVCLLARPESEALELSAACTRWLVRWSPSPTMSRRWSVELLRCKGLRHADPGRPRERAAIHQRDAPLAPQSSPQTPTPHAHACSSDHHLWTLERDHATRHLRVVPNLLGGSGVEETPAPPGRRVG